MQWLLLLFYRLCSIFSEERYIEERVHFLHILIGISSLNNSLLTFFIKGEPSPGTASIERFINNNIALQTDRQYV